ncbi:ASCH domain-containing protein [Roseomonas cutis]|uniref:ASCH domain-containing protein n=1 Tax=Roseomonas cutis TaxID=2897332 RepID=UPI00272C8A33|nr:ASCH domain-containing protein [Roseomonas sp. OT10]
MDSDTRPILEAAFPGEEARYFLPMVIGGAPEHAEAGAGLILAGTKTLTSSPFWDYPDGKLPFVGALSVLLDGSGRARGIVETVRLEVLPFGAVTEEMARDYGEGDRTLAWWRRAMGEFYRASAARAGEALTEGTPLLWEWLDVRRRF